MGMIIGLFLTILGSVLVVSIGCYQYQDHQSPFTVAAFWLAENKPAVTQAISEALIPHDREVASQLKQQLLATFDQSVKGSITRELNHQTLKKPPYHMTATFSVSLFDNTFPYGDGYVKARVPFVLDVGTNYQINNYAVDHSAVESNLDCWVTPVCGPN